jgi:hypothetical protein
LPELKKTDPPQNSNKKEKKNEQEKIPLDNLQLLVAD